MTHATPDILALCAVIDAGDDSALLPLADAMEEIGDPLATGLRKAACSGYRPRLLISGEYQWLYAKYPVKSGELPGSIMDRFLGGPFYRNTYANCHAAYLALAAALIVPEISTNG